VQLTSTTVICHLCWWTLTG